MPIAQETIHYSTYVKKALREGMELVFNEHVDEILTRTKVDIEFPMDQADYPAVIVRFFERSITNLGVGHREWLPEYDALGEPTGNYIKYKHYYFTGDIEFAIYALSSLDRDLVGDSVVQTLTMGDLTDYTNNLFQRIYEPDRIQSPESDDTFINLNTDEVSGFGETQVQAPWLPEDVLVYQKSYRVNITGEFYSLTPDAVSYGPIESVDVYPYVTDLEAIPSGLQDKSEWSDDFAIDRSASYSFAGTPTDFTVSGGELVLPDSAPLTLSPTGIILNGDLQIDTHFRWDGSNHFELVYYWHVDHFDTPVKRQQRAELILDPLGGVYLGNSFVPGRLPSEWAAVLTRPFDITNLIDIDLWWRLKVEDYKFTSELWVANPVSSFKTNRIFRASYQLTPEERGEYGGQVWGRFLNDGGGRILDWAVTSPNTVEWIGETTLIG